MPPAPVIAVELLIATTVGVLIEAHDSHWGRVTAAVLLLISLSIVVRYPGTLRSLFRRSSDDQHKLYHQRDVLLGDARGASRSNSRR